MRFCGRWVVFFTSGFAGGGSRQFNHFYAELTARADSQVAGATVSITSLQNWPQARFVRSCWKLRCKKRLLLLGCHTDSILLRKICRRASGLFQPHPKKTVAFPKTCGNFSTKPRPTTPKAKVVRPEQIRVTIFPQKSHPEARQTAGMRYNV